MSLASVKDFLANIAARQKKMALPNVFRFKKVASGRKANGPLIAAVYPGDMDADEAEALRAAKAKKQHKKRSTRKKAKAEHESCIPAGTHRLTCGNTCGFADPRIRITCGHRSPRIQV